MGSSAETVSEHMPCLSTYEGLLRKFFFVIRFREFRCLPERILGNIYRLCNQARLRVPLVSTSADSGFTTRGLPVDNVALSSSAQPRPLSDRTREFLGH